MNCPSYSEFPPEGLPLLTSCQRACPVETDASTYVALIAQGNFRKAMAVVREENPLPAICGRVCDHQCEGNCRRGESDAPVAIRALKRFLTDRERSGKVRWPRRMKVRRPEKLAVIGSGPAGLTAAADLLRSGYGVTVFEKLPVAGGMMRVGIPDYRLPPEVLDFDLEYLRRTGVEVVLNAALGRDFTLSHLREEGYKAAVLATGAHGSRPLALFTEGGPLRPVDESAFPGLSAGIEFLRQVKLGQKPKLPSRVLVIGGGDVAMDTARTALRLGAEDVSLFCLESREEMPAHDWETREALDECVRFHCGWGPVELSETSGILRMVFAACTSVFDKSGRFNPTLDFTQSTIIETQAVLTSIGQYAEFSHSPEDGIAAKPNHLYAADPITHQTSAGWVFAAGDAAHGMATVIKAVASGHRAAASVQEYLEGKPLTGCRKTTLRKRRVERLEPPPGWEELTPLREGEIPIEDRLGSFSEVRLGLSEQEAVAEALRCMRCDAETKSYTYSRKNRERIYHMARDLSGDEGRALEHLSRKLSEGTGRRTRRRKPSFDDLVFLPANLTRLVIDPYREECNTRTVLGGGAPSPLEMEGPIVIGGVAFSKLSEQEIESLGHGAALAGVGFRRPISTPVGVGGARAIGVISLSAPPAAVSGLSALELDPEDAAVPLEVSRLKEILGSYRTLGLRVPIGVTLGPEGVEQNIGAVMEAGADFVTLAGLPRQRAADGACAFDETVPPRIEVLAEAVETLRSMNHEEDLDLVYVGGIRSGADVARALSLGATAVMIGAAARIAAQTGLPTASGVAEDQHETPAERLARFISAILMEAAILARCCGKTDVHNLEPEDLRSLTMETSAATGAPVVGRDQVFRKTLAGN